jgi:hypothetical protein
VLGNVGGGSVLALAAAGQSKLASSQQNKKLGPQNWAKNHQERASRIADQIIAWRRICSELRPPRRTIAPLCTLLLWC